MKKQLYTCPSCGFPTLEGRGVYDICVLCNWEDDGQDDPNADEVWGGPNGSLSLKESRVQFEQFLKSHLEIRQDLRDVELDKFVRELEQFEKELREDKVVFGSEEFDERRRAFLLRL